MNNHIEKYLNQDINNPKYLFHGSPLKLDVIEPRLSKDTKGNEKNIANAIFLFPSFLKATPYAFKDTIKEKSKLLNWGFEIPNTNDFLLMIMENVIIDETIKGYIYVFEKSDDMIKDNFSYQYKCYKKLIPCDMIEVYYKDFKDYYEVRNLKKSL